MDRDYIWEADYGDRTKLVGFLKELLRSQDANCLQCLGVFVNNDPYNLELFVYLSYDAPSEDQLEFMQDGLKKLGLIYRKDLTLDEMFVQMGNRQFNSYTMVDEQMVELVMSNVFWFPERKEMEKNGYHFGQFKKRPRVFISHASIDKPIIEKIIPFITAINLNVWVDKYDINIGESVEKKVFEGINEADAVIFWITKSFLDSDWCKLEWERFVSKAVANELLLISVINEDVDKEQIPKELRQLKYISRKSGDNIDITVDEIVTTLKKYYSMR